MYMQNRNRLTYRKTCGYQREGRGEGKFRGKGLTDTNYYE